MSQLSTVLISASEFIDTLKGRTAAQGTELLAFTDAEALRALETITRRKPQVVAARTPVCRLGEGVSMIYDSRT